MSEQTPTHRAWGKLRAWLKESRDADRAEAAKVDAFNWRRPARIERANAFDAVLTVMEAEMRQAKRKRR